MYDSNEKLKKQLRFSSIYRQSNRINNTIKVHDSNGQISASESMYMDSDVGDCTVTLRVGECGACWWGAGRKQNDQPLSRPPRDT